MRAALSATPAITVGAVIVAITHKAESARAPMAPDAQTAARQLHGSFCTRVQPKTDGICRVRNLRTVELLPAP